MSLWGVVGGQNDVGGEAADMEGEGEQQEERAAEEGHRGEDFRRTENVRKLQAPQALRQQRSPQSPLQRGRMDRRARRHHLPEGTPSILRITSFSFSSLLAVCGTAILSPTCAF